ncbi:MAG TPA: ABC transporter permease [Clostridia bacterium]|nr:ABC transporter permease [Clostridia bacterium]
MMGLAGLLGTFLIPLFESSVRLAVPLLMAGLGETFSEKSGVINIGLEGIMLTGAFASFVVTYSSGSPYYGIIVAALMGGVLGLVFAFSTVSLEADQIVAGTALNMFAMGVTGFLYRKYYGLGGAAATVNTLPQLAIPGLVDIPVLGPVLFNQNVVVYLAFALVPVAAVILKRSSIGISLVATGEHPKAADSVGIDVFKVRYATCVVTGVLAGIGGGFLSVGHANTFFEMMTAGRGFIALAVVIFGKWNPWGVLGASLLFGGANSFQLRLQAMGRTIPYHLVLMIPYVLTILAVAGVSRRRVNAPRYLGVPYEKT